MSNTVVHASLLILTSVLTFAGDCHLIGTNKTDFVGFAHYPESISKTNHTSAAVCNLVCAE